MQRRTTSMNVLRLYDVRSLYPSIMINESLLSRAVPEPEFYKEIYDNRIKAKQEKDIPTSNALKLVLNTTYGASLRDGNRLYDPNHGRSICIIGQLGLTLLAKAYQYYLPGEVEIIQINTDGILIKFDDGFEPLIQMINSKWEDISGLVLDETRLKAIYQKDVNNYIAILEDGRVKGKGGWVNAHFMPDETFLNNDLKVVATAIVKYFAEDIPVRETIEAETNILNFQMICHASSKFSDVFYMDNPVQKTNRVYASKDESLGTLYKKSIKTQSLSRFPNAPEHVVIDNENKLTIDDIDLEWYISLAKERTERFVTKTPPLLKMYEELEQEKK